MSHVIFTSGDEPETYVDNDDAELSNGSLIAHSNRIFGAFR